MTVGVVGNGETAGAVVVALLDTLPEGSVIELISPQGVLYSRGESFAENRLYSSPEPDWPRLAERAPPAGVPQAHRPWGVLTPGRALAGAG